MRVTLPNGFWGGVFAATGVAIISLIVDYNVGKHAAKQAVREVLDEREEKKP